MKRLISLLAALVLLVSLTACSEGGLNLDLNRSGDASKVIEPDKDGVAAGYVGDTLRTSFFDMKVENPKTVTEFDGLTPDAGCKFLTADLTLYNYTNNSQPMFDTDFTVLWDVGQGEDATLDGDYPLYEEYMDENGNTSYRVRSEKQMPVEFTLGIHETRTELLLFQVPEDVRDFYIAFEENFDNGTAEGEAGDFFYVRFSA